MELQKLIERNGENILKTCSKKRITYKRIREEEKGVELEGNRINEIEIKKQIEKLKENKATGEDKIENVVCVSAETKH